MCRKCFPSNEAYRDYHRERRAANRQKYRDYYREYNREYRKKYGYINERISHNRHKEKVKARRIFWEAIKKGIILRQPCSVCGKPDAQGHHEDYSKPLAVMWFCVLHHSEHEKRALELK